MQMGMKTYNIRLKTPKINPQSNPNKKNVQKLPGGARNGGCRRRSFAKNW